MLRFVAQSRLGRALCFDCLLTCWFSGAKPAAGCFVSESGSGFGQLCQAASFPALVHWFPVSLNGAFHVRSLEAAFRVFLILCLQIMFLLEYLL